jgi:N-acetylglutamate synthase-like GNAT family acetyltransferase
MSIVTHLLIEVPEALSPLAALMERADLSERLQRDRLPLGIVAMVDGEIAGTCALTITSGGLVIERSPWLGGLLVDPALRRKGVGGALLMRARQEAGRLGHRHLYALTTHADALFVHEGWRVVETTMLQTEPHRIFVVTTQGHR